jgi:beta-glucosidase-like glycosyl hydrolase/8-oxo-dGTP pyrophosphatase MutT (NUDIX family)
VRRIICSGYVRYENGDGPVITSAGDRIHTEGQQVFRVAGESDRFLPYMDWRLSPVQRAEDLAARMSPGQILPMLSIGFETAAGACGGSHVNLVTGDYLTEEACVRRNALQHAAERTGLGIPLRFCCPGPVRNGQLPGPLGSAALFDPGAVRTSALLAGEILRAAGISGLVGPRASIATDPRWSVFPETFGTSAQLVTDALRAAIEGFQAQKARETGADGISCVTGVWPGFSSGNIFSYEGRKCTGHSAGLHLKPFVEGAWKLAGGGTADAVLARTEVGILRDVYSYKGIIMLDWLNWRNRFDSDAQALAQAVMEGADLFAAIPAGPELFADMMRIVDREEGAGSAERHIRESALRVFSCMFSRGIYENPYADFDRMRRLASDTAYRNLAGDMRRGSIVLLKDMKHLLPLTRLCDVNIVTVRSHGVYPIPEDVKRLQAAKKSRKPLAVILSCHQPMLLQDVEPYADILLADCGAKSRDIFDVLTGRKEPSGLLPFQFPADESEIGGHFADVPFDMNSYRDADGALYGFAYGRNYSGVISDGRVSRYNSESWDALDRDGNHLGFPLARIMAKSLDPGIYHRVVIIYTETPSGRILVTQRAPVKTYPYHWEVTGGSVLRGETPVEGAIRELKEETGIFRVPRQMIRAYTHVDDGRHCIYDAFATCLPDEKPKIRLQEGETIAWRLLSEEDFRACVESDEFVASEQGRYREHRDEIWSALKSLIPIEKV